MWGALLVPVPAIFVGPLMNLYILRPGLRLYDGDVTGILHWGINI